MLNSKSKITNRVISAGYTQRLTRSLKKSLPATISTGSKPGTSKRLLIAPVGVIAQNNLLLTQLKKTSVGFLLFSLASGAQAILLQRLVFGVEFQIELD